MRRLLLLRHAKAERSAPGGQDLSRVLIERGRRDAARIGAYMAGHALAPERVIVSPSARTRETWKYVAAAFKPGPAATLAERLYDATPQDILGVAAGAPEPARTVMLVGHNPSLHEAALMLIAAGDVDTRELLREKLPTCGLVVIDFAFDDWSRLHPHSGRLERFVSPRSLEAAAN